MEKSPIQKYNEIQSLVQTEARKIAEEVYATKATQYGVPKVPYHIHNGIDSPLISSSGASGSQYSTTVNVTSNTTSTITAGFKPKQVFAYASMYFDGTGTGEQLYGVSAGVAGVTSPVAGKCSALVHGTNEYNNTSTHDYLVGFGTVYAYISSWTSTGIVLVQVVPANWSLSTKLVII